MTDRNDIKIDPIELHGKKSASQRREYALQVEGMRMKILADHLRAVLILLIQRTGQSQTFLKKDIEATLGMPLESVDTEDKLGVVFSTNWPDHPEDVPGPRNTIHTTEDDEEEPT